MKLLFKRKRPEIEILHYGIGYAVKVNKKCKSFFVGIDGVTEYGERSFNRDSFVFQSLESAKQMRDIWEHHLEPIEEEVKHDR